MLFAKDNIKRIKFEFCKIPLIFMAKSEKAVEILSNRFEVQYIYKATHQ